MNNAILKKALLSLAFVSSSAFMQENDMHISKKDYLPSTIENTLRKEDSITATYKISEHGSLKNRISITYVALPLELQRPDLYYTIHQLRTKIGKYIEYYVVSKDSSGTDIIGVLKSEKLNWYVDSCFINDSNSRINTIKIKEQTDCSLLKKLF